MSTGSQKTKGQALSLRGTKESENLDFLEAKLVEFFHCLL